MAVTMVLAGAVILVETVRVARNRRYWFYIAVGLASLGILRATVLFYLPRGADSEGLADGVAVRGT